MMSLLSLLFRLLALLMAASLIAVACGDFAPDSLAYTSNETDAAPQSVLRIATPRIRGLERAIDDWEREHPTARVEIIVRSLDDHHRSVLDDSGASGTFDIVGFDASYGPDIRDRPELFLDLSTFDNGLADEYLASRWAEGIGNDGRLIGLPLDVDSAALIVRTDLVSPELIDRLEQASTWCDFISVGKDFSEETNTAFLPDSDELFQAILAQNRLSFIDERGQLIEAQQAQLERAWDLTMLAIGEPALHGDPCPDSQRASGFVRNLPSGGEQWRLGLRGGAFAAVITQYSELRSLTSTAPDTSGNWTIIELPGPAGSSSGGLHLGVSADTVHPALAYDLVSTLAHPIIQENAFASGSGPFPSASVLYDSQTVTGYTDEFFGDAPVGSVFVATAENRPDALAQPIRRLAIEQFSSAVNLVENENLTPGQAWDEVLWRIEQFLS